METSLQVWGSLGTKLALSCTTIAQQKQMFSPRKQFIVICNSTCFLLLKTDNSLILTKCLQVEELRTQLTKAEGDRKGLQHQVSSIAKQQSSHQDDLRDDWRFRRGIILHAAYVASHPQRCTPHAVLSNLSNFLIIYKVFQQFCYSLEFDLNFYFA